MTEIKIIEFPRVQDPRGNLTFLQNFDHIPFAIRRVFCTYDVPGGETRGGHAYRKQEEVIIALSGAFDVVITHKNGNEERFHMNRSYYGLHLPPNTWRHMENFSTNSFGLHVSSSTFDSDDYIRDFQLYRDEKRD